MKLTEKELGAISELLALEENIMKKYQMYEGNSNCELLHQGKTLHQSNIQKLYSFLG